MPQRSHIPLAALGLVAATVAALSARTDTVVDAPADEASTRLYECRSATGRVYSDKPCGPDATVLDVVVSLSTYTPPPMVTSSARRAPAARTGTANTVAHATDTRQDARCDALFRRKAWLDSRMRAGYSAPAGERLRAEHRDVTKELYTRRCSKLG